MAELESRIRQRLWRRRAAAFTMLELLVVVVIAGLMAALAVPSFVRGYQSARIRTSARSVVMAHRYARGQAVLRQQPVVLIFQQGAGRLEVQSQERLPPPGGAEDFAAGMTESIAADLASGAPRTVATLSRSLEKDVVIERVEMEGRSPNAGDVWRISYQPSGMGEAARLILADDKGRRLAVVLDALSGSARVEEP